MSKNYDLAIVGSVGLPSSYGGFETLVEELVLGFGDRFRVLVYCTKKKRKDFPSSYLNADLDYIGFDANGWQSILYDFVALWRSVKVAKTVLVLGVSGCLLLPVLRMRYLNVRFVTNIDGLEWRRKKWGLVARFFLQLSEFFAVNFSHEIISDNKGIQEYVSSKYGVQSSFIPYGGDNKNQSKDDEISHSQTFGVSNYFFSVCRIEPENNIHLILRAFYEDRTKNLVMVGNWVSSAYGSDLKNSYSEYSNIQLLDPIYDQSILFKLRSESIGYIHGHSAGGTNPSLVEAMNAGVAIFCFDVIYNRYTTENQAFYWSKSSDLLNLISTLSDDSLKESASVLKKIASHRYSWKAIVYSYEKVLFI